MNSFRKRAEELRNDPNRHFNCAQGVFIPFAENKGIDTETANAIAANFGAGMRCGSVCGAVTGGLMALGLYGMDNPFTVSEFIRGVRDRHEGMLECADLLSANARTDMTKKQHCDGMVYECLDQVYRILTEKGLLKAEE